MNKPQLNDTVDTHNYDILKSWIEDSLDQFKQDLLQIKYPLFIHTYFDLLLKSDLKSAKSFFVKNVDDFDVNGAELRLFGAFEDPGHIKENSMALAYKTTKYKVNMGKYAFNLLLNFLEENELNYLLRLINQHVEIQLNGVSKGILHSTNSTINLTTFLVSNECEESILRDEKYKYDHLETFVLNMRKKRENKNTGYSASYIGAEIEKLKDLLKRVPCATDDLPSAICYTIYNSEDVTCAELSPDLKFLAVAKNVIEVHALSEEPIKLLKPSSELEMSETKNQFDEKTSIKLIGHSAPVYSIKFFQTSKFLVSASQDCTARLWSVELGSCLAVYKSGFPFWSVDITRDFYVALGSADRTCSVISLLNPKERLFTALSDVTCVKFHPNSNYLFYGSADCHVRMVDIHTSELVRAFSNHTDMVTAIDVSHCGQFLATGSRDKSVCVFDIQSGKLIYQQKGSSSVSSVSFCWFGSILSCGYLDGSLRLFSNGKLLGTYYTKNTPIYGARFGYRNILGVVGPYINVND